MPRGFAVRIAQHPDQPHHQQAEGGASGQAGVGDGHQIGRAEGERGGGLKVTRHRGLQTKGVDHPQQPDERTHEGRAQQAAQAQQKQAHAAFLGELEPRWVHPVARAEPDLRDAT